MQSRHVLQLSTLWAIISVCASPVCASPATNPAGEGPGIAIGAGSNASHEGVVLVMRILMETLLLAKTLPLIITMTNLVR